IILLPIVAILLLQVPFVQNFARGKVESYLRNKFHTEVRIGQVRLYWWTSLHLSNVVITDQRKQALFYSGSLQVNYNLLSLLKNKLVIKRLVWDNVLANVYR